MIQFIQFVYTTFFCVLIHFFLLFWTFFLSFFELLCLKDSLLILEESERNWGKFHWNLRLFYIDKKHFQSHGILFLNITTQRFSLARRVSMIANPHYEQIFSLHDAIFKWIFFSLCCFCSLSHTHSETGADTPSNEWSRRRTFFVLFERKTHFSVFEIFFRLMVI